MSETSKGKKIRKLLIDEQLEELLLNDVNTYMNDYGASCRDTIFIFIAQKENRVTLLSFYAINEIIDDFEYVGYFYCRNILFLFKDTGANEENLLPFIVKSDEFKNFPAAPLKHETGDPMPDDIFFIYYTYENDILKREIDY